MVDKLYEKILKKQEKLAVVGLGYVGLPIAVAFSNAGVSVIGYDTNEQKLEKYREGIDVTSEVGSEALHASNIYYTSDSESISSSSFIIVCVPTPTDSNNEPDFNPLLNACRSIGQAMKKGSCVVFESTVYPGATESICIPELEKYSGMKCGVDFKVGFSPERINPGDRLHTLENTTKVVSAIDDETLLCIKSIYEIIIKAGVFCASNIKTAEAIKITENTQRDLNIAFMNEMSLLYHKLGIDTNEVVNGMNTKWNALGFKPGLVGGHCIGIDPYYLLHLAKSVGNDCKLVQVARETNELISDFIVDSTKCLLGECGKNLENSKIGVLGLTFKENCGDLRNSKAGEVITKLKKFGATVCVVDPLANEDEAESLYEVKLQKFSSLCQLDCLMILVAHDEFKQIKEDDLHNVFITHNQNKIIMDIKSIFDKNTLIASNYKYFSL